jgi:hypothetical protein
MINETHNIQNVTTNLEDSIEAEKPLSPQERAIATTVLSAMPLVFALGIHTAWRYVSPETHSEGAEILNYGLALGAFLGDFAVQAYKGRFD